MRAGRRGRQLADLEMLLPRQTRRRQPKVEGKDSIDWRGEGHGEWSEEMLLGGNGRVGRGLGGGRGEGEEEQRVCDMEEKDAGMRVKGNAGGEAVRGSGGGRGLGVQGVSPRTLDWPGDSAGSQAE